MPAIGDVLLDTSVVVRYFRKDAAIHQQILDCATLYLPQTALGELYCGAHLSTNPTKALADHQLPRGRDRVVSRPRDR
jgi:predicted nucleic acid-binding protein